MCFNAKNLYNYANYIIRQHYFETKEYYQYRQLNHDIKSHESYKACMSQPANCVLRMLDKAWKSYFVGYKDWKRNPKKYLGMPKPPRYLDKNGRYIWAIPNNSCYLYGTELKFRIRKLQDYVWKTHITDGRLIQVRFIPKGTCYIMEIVYEIEIGDEINDEIEYVAAIDLGVDNLVTMTNNIGKRPIIINGKGVKSINQFYNKRKVKLQSELKIRHGKNWSKRLEAITFKRDQRIKNYMHNTSRWIVNWCKANQIDTLIVGYNAEWKQNSKMNKQSNQKFIMIPHQMLVKQLLYKCETEGIKCIITEESYTSGTSFIDGESPCKENYNKNRRVKRGLFKTNNGLLINADVNGSLQIMSKVFPNADIKCYGVEGILNPVIINTTVVG